MNKKKKTLQKTGVQPEIEHFFPRTRAAVSRRQTTESRDTAAGRERHNKQVFEQTSGETGETLEHAPPIPLAQLGMDLGTQSETEGGGTLEPPATTRKNSSALRRSGFKSTISGSFHPSRYRDYGDSL